MWPENETGRDFLNFSGVADMIAENRSLASGVGVKALKLRPQSPSELARQQKRCRLAESEP